MSNRLAIVTGSSAGIGEALTSAFLEQGWTVLGMARRPVQRGDQRYEHLQVDLSSADAVDSTAVPAVAEAIQRMPWERVALINNAALVGQLTTIDRFTTHDLWTLLAVNTGAPVRLAGSALSACPAETPLRIVNVSSGAAMDPFPGLSDYCISKAALHMASRAIAAEAELTPERDLAVLSWEPGVVETNMQELARAQPKEHFPSSDAFHHFRDAGIVVAPEEVVAQVVDFVEGTSRGFSEARWSGNE